MRKRIIQITLSALFFAAVFLLLPLTVSASSIENKKVRVGYYNNEVFEDGTSDEDIKKGYAYEYYRKISEYTGWEYEYVYGDFVSIYQMLLDGDVDLVAGLAYSDERASLILYPKKPMGAESYGIVKHENDTSISRSYNTLNGKKIGVLESAIVNVLRDFLDEQNINATVITYNDYDQVLEAFDKKELDAIAAEIDGIYDRKHAEVLYSIGEADYYLGVNKNKPELLTELNEAQEMLFTENPGYLSTLRNKYYSSTLSSRAFTESETNWLSTHTDIRVGYLNNFMPYSSTDENGNPQGIIKDVIPYLLKELGIDSVNCKFVGFDRYDDIVKAIADDEIDLGFPLGGGLYFSERDGLSLTNPVISSVTDLVFTEQYKGSSDTTFAVCEKNNLQKYYIKNYYPDSNIAFYPTLDDCLAAVYAGEATCTTIDGLRTSAILSAHKDNSFSFAQLSASEDHCFGVKKGNEGLLKLLNRGISITGQDYIQNLAMDYARSMYTYTFWDFVMQYAWQILIVIIILVLIANFVAIKILRSRERYAREIMDSKIQIEKANQDKFTFVNNITNNMREPMSKLTSLIDSSKRTDDPDKIQENLNAMAEQSRLLITLVNNIAIFVRSNEEQNEQTDK